MIDLAKIKTRSLKLDRMMKTEIKFPYDNYACIDNLEVVVADTIENLIEGLTKVPVAELADVTGCDSNGNETTFSIKEYMDSCRDMGCFGYSDEPNKKIYIWFDKDVNITILINLLAHESAHQTEKKQSNDPDLQSEFAACRCGELAQWAYNTAINLLNKEKTNGTKSKQ